MSVHSAHRYRDTHKSPGWLGLKMALFHYHHSGVTVSNAHNQTNEPKIVQEPGPHQVLSPHLYLNYVSVKTIPAVTTMSYKRLNIMTLTI